MITIITLITTIIMMMGGNAVDTVQVYPQTFAVVEVEDNIVTVVDTVGNEWAFESAEDWQRGDLVSAIMSDMGTPNYIYDDEFITEKYSGFCHDSFGWDSEVNMPIVDFSEKG